MTLHFTVVIHHFLITTNVNWLIEDRGFKNTTTIKSNEPGKHVKVKFKTQTELNVDYNKWQYIPVFRLV